MAWGPRGPRPTGRSLAWWQVPRVALTPGEEVTPGKNICDSSAPGSEQGPGELPRMNLGLALNGVTLASDLTPCLSVPSPETGQGRAAP